MKIIDYQKLTQKKWLNMFDIVYEDKSGREKIWQVVSRQATPKCISGEFDYPDAVLMIPFHTTEQKLVIIREYRLSLGAFQYEFPAGLVDEGETIETAAERELKEETGLTVSRFIKMSPPIYSSAGMTDESVAMVYVECEGTPSNTANTEFELIEVLLITPAEALRMCSDVTLKFDAKAWLEISQFAENGRPKREADC